MNYEAAYGLSFPRFHALHPEVRLKTILCTDDLLWSNSGGAGIEHSQSV